MELTILVDVDASNDYVVTLSGSLDLQSRAELEERAKAAFGPELARSIVLDLAGVTFIDSTGIGAVVALAGDASEAGIRFALRNPSARVARILEITGLRDTWDIETS